MEAHSEPHIGAERPWGPAEEAAPEQSATREVFHEEGKGSLCAREATAPTRPTAAPNAHKAVNAEGAQREQSGARRPPSNELRSIRLW